MQNFTQLETSNGGNGPRVPVDIQTKRGGGDDSGGHVVYGSTVKFALDMAAMRLQVSLDMLFETKRGKTVYDHIVRGRYREACKVLAAMNHQDLRQLAPE